MRKPDGIMPYDPDRGIQEAGNMWALERNRRRLRCFLTTHPLGWELRVDAEGEVVRTQVCRQQAEVFEIAEGWKRSAEAAGWR